MSFADRIFATVCLLGLWWAWLHRILAAPQGYRRAYYPLMAVTLLLCLLWALVANNGIDRDRQRRRPE